ncbi:MAG: hypothetical protein U0556_13950 [Dehalococcoidia bacterium]
MEPILAASCADARERLTVATRRLESGGDRAAARDAAEAALDVASCCHSIGSAAERERALGLAADGFARLLGGIGRDEVIDPGLIDIGVVLNAVLTAWAAGRFDLAASFGSLPTETYRPKNRARPDEPAMFATFAVSSAARGNALARDRAIAYARDAIGAGRTKDLTTARGENAPLLDGLDAVTQGRAKALDRALAKLLRFHAWRYRAGELPQCALDIRSLGLARWAAQQGVLTTVEDPRLPISLEEKG